ncbi:DUF1223 domain-containing protein [Jannaschia aquimarina]|uniref:Secreted protein n=1 Tax=Jannaschia aquimarina TaxID=935700 RepID=A0A0D1EGJ9_9RHOB|nr:DUF1223 domain-containing protein [Jannaschia aquimarina]KIT16046.1 hypothetical protein jaqu_23170 [Jannaschia aquimarina]SNT00992.1 hypothetical protein SAMN05421775_104228 [Jannaschia aquimarina]
MRLALAITACISLPASADPVVVELFTSQGCSSCPPADAMLHDLAEREDVIALSLHVDYWDWIGWEDTFGDAAHTERQKAYAAREGSSVVYTPQFVIDGQVQIAGAKGMKVSEAVSAHSGGAEVLEIDGDRLLLSGQDSRADLVMAHVLPEIQVAIGHGENAGRTITYANVVQGWENLGSWDGAPGGLDLPARRDGMIRVVLAQEIDAKGRPSAILGAARDR